MPQLFWSGKLSLPMKLLVEMNNILALFTGSANNTHEMKGRVKLGYEGKFSAHVQQYDELGYRLQDRSARYQLENINLKDMQVLDVGCGTGALAAVALENGAKRINCGDISAYMLKQAKGKELAKNANHSFCQLDAEALPFKDNALDAAISGMTFGVLPDQQQALNEMIRVVKPGGLICIGAHGPEHYWEAIDASFRCINKRYILGYRLEWWPRTEEFIRNLLERENLDGIQSRRIIWRNEFADGTAVYDFFAAISASWWYAKFPPDQIDMDSQNTRNYFERKNINTITDDIVVAYGYKPMRG
jgi:ubiquinone/menaquinone biosynthesis C-methylase UbiE